MRPAAAYFVSAGDSSTALIAWVAAGLVVVGLVVLVLIEQRRRRVTDRLMQAPPDPERLSRFTGALLRDPSVFGGGATGAWVGLRRETVAYGYLAVAEEYMAADSVDTWCTLTITLPGALPYVVADHRAALGRPGVPAPGATTVPTGDPVFDGAFTVAADDPHEAGRVLVPGVRRALVLHGMQRLALRGRALLLRTTDQCRLDDATLARLTSAATEILASAPSFVQAAGIGPGAGRGERPLPPGFYGREAP